MFVTDDHFDVLHRKYQNAMLGLLAIEQLTSSVAQRPASKQVILTSSANALLQGQEGLTEARNRLEEAETADVKAKEDLEKEKSGLTEATTALKKATDESKTEEIPNLEQKQKDQLAKKEEAERHSEKTAKELETAKKVVKEMEEKGNKLVVKTNSGGITNAGQQDTSCCSIPKETAQSLAETVQNVVKQVLGGYCQVNRPLADWAP